MMTLPYVILCLVILGIRNGQVDDQLRENAAGRVRGATRSHRGDER